MKTVLFVAAAASAVVTSADAGFLGFVASSRTVGAVTVIDIFAGVQNANDKFLNVYNTTSNGVFVQKAGLANKTWKPDAAGWNATPASPAATTIPALAGWYTGDPTSVDNNAESLAGLVGRVNGTNAAGANFGIWCAHLVLTGNQVIGTDFTFSAFASIKDGVSGAVSQASSSFPVPAPGAIALLGLAGFSARRRRA
jgi:MYXO-CTERM domain-containing protein